MPKSVEEYANPAAGGLHGTATAAQSGATSAAEPAAPAASGPRRDGVAAEEPSAMDTGNAEAVASAEGPAVIHSDLMKIVPGPPVTEEQKKREQEVLADDAALEDMAMKDVSFSLKGLFHKKDKDENKTADRHGKTDAAEQEGEPERAPTVA